MKPRNIALVGKARSGKDTVAAQLQREHFYTRVAFADPLKEMALDIDPLIESWDNERLSSTVDEIGWERAKDEHPEVRRLLQHMGQTVRKYDPDFWVRIAMEKIRVAESWGLPVVVTDVRYPNELAALESAGFMSVRIYRPTGGVAYGGHTSETALDDCHTDHVLMNDGSLDALTRAVARMLT